MITAISINASPANLIPPQKIGKANKR